MTTAVNAVFSSAPKTKRSTEPRAKREQLEVRRDDIRFTTNERNQVQIAIRVVNAGSSLSAPTTLYLESAPLGAFVPWRPLTELLVPPLGPGESAVARTEIRRPEPSVLGDFASVPPRKLLTAVGAGDWKDLSRAPVGPRGLFRGLAGPRPSAGQDANVGAGLAPDPSDLLGRANVHWAGNLNVFVGGKRVERHVARALRVYPGRTNLATFVVGGSSVDAYAFHLEGEGANWDCALYDVSCSHSLLPDDRFGVSVDGSQWIETRGSSIMILAIAPPQGCGDGNVEVHVRQRSSGESAMVEFSLSPTAKGPGCYTL